jgi:hypothetical protein
MEQVDRWAGARHSLPANQPKSFVQGPPGKSATQKSQFGIVDADWLGLF